MSDPAAERDYLQALLQRLTATLDSFVDHVIIFDADGRLAWVNRVTREAARGVGLDPDAYMGKLPGEIPHTRGAEEFLAEVRARGVATRELFLPQDGGRWREDMGTAVRADDGTLVALAVVSRDVHERKVTEARIRALAGLSALARTSDHAQLLTALAALAVPDLADWALAVADARDPALGDVGARLAAGAGSFQAEPRGPLFEDARVRSLIAVPLAVAGAPPAALLLGMKDKYRTFTPDDLVVAEGLVERVRQIAENARLTDALARSEARFRIALGNSNIAVFELGRDDAVSWIHAPDFGRYADEPPGQRPNDFASLARTPDYAALVADAQASGARVQKEIAFQVGGEKRHARVNLEPIVSGCENVGITGAAVDVSEERRAQDELAQALVFRERVLSVLGHDLGNPLSAVRGLTALLLRREALDADSREVLGQIDLAARRMGEMIETIIDFSRARFKGGLLITRRHTDLRDVAGGVIAELRAARPDRVVELGVDGEARGEWDPGRLAQALSNLIGNALTHGAHDRPVRVAISEGAGEVRIAVVNEGKPIPPDAIPALFEPFRRGQAVEEARVPGLGLGLFIVRQIAEAHGGDVSVESTPAATTFTLRLPRS